MLQIRCIDKIYNIKIVFHLRPHIVDQPSIDGRLEKKFVCKFLLSPRFFLFLQKHFILLSWVLDFGRQQCRLTFTIASLFEKTFSFTNQLRPVSEPPYATIFKFLEQYTPISDRRHLIGFPCKFLNRSDTEGIRNEEKVRLYNQYGLIF